MGVPYPTSMDVMYTEVIFDEHFPPTFVKELKEKFPEWTCLHFALDKNDQKVWGLLQEYEKRLSKFTPEQILEATEDSDLQELVDRARQAIEMRDYFANLEPRFFPEKLAERKRRDQERSAQEAAYYGY